MTCIECLIISFSTILCLMWETYKRDDIILHDENLLNTDKLENLDETDAIFPGS